MTSKHLFFKAMREDMRNRVWMTALSVLGSLLMLPVTWLIYIQNMRGSLLNAYSANIDQADLFISVIEYFWRNVANYLVGILIIGGALVAALAGFRFVFHKNQVDTWHSLPIKRDMLFWTCYINGVIVWLLPLLIGTVLTAVLSGGLALGEWNGSPEYFYEVIKLAAGNFAVWTVVFLLVYNLVLLAMMFSGNVLNTMVSMLIMGVGGASLYALSVTLCEVYFDTFFFLGSRNALGAMYASPFVSAMTLLLERGEEVEGYSVWCNLLIATVLAVGSWLLYRRRPSELAEQGIQSGIISTALRFATVMGAGVGGWLFFDAIANDNIMWCVFGVFLAVVLVHGVLDVVFRMDFRAFFAHKLQMTGAVAAAMLVCLAFYGDWFGYDAYLPEREQVAKISVKVESLSNRWDFMIMGWYPLEAMEYGDIETAYAFLQKMTQASVDGQTWGESVEVCITLNNGRRYYRRYYVGEGERELIMPIVSSEEYLGFAYCLNESVLEEHEVTLQPIQGFGTKKFAKGELLDFIRAYNQDVLEHPEAVLLGEGRILTELSMSFLRADGYRAAVSLDIYESMERTIEALKALGYESIVTPVKTAEITSIELSVDDFGMYRTAEDIVEAAREKYQVFGAENAGEQGGEGAAGEAMEVESVSQDIVYTRRADLTLYITDPEEIEELLPLISYGDGYKRWGVFKKPFVSIGITDREGGAFTCYIGQGDLPEKYIRRFGELIQDSIRE